MNMPYLKNHRCKNLSSFCFTLEENIRYKKKSPQLTQVHITHKSIDPFCVDESALKLIVGMVAQLCEY